MAVARQRWRLFVTVAFLALLLSPALRDGDGVPLSSYPMYATPRSGEVEFVVARGITPAGEVVRLDIEDAAATSDPLIAETRLRREVAAGRAVDLCREIAARVADTGLASIEVRSERHDVVAQARGHSSLLQGATVAECAV